MLWNYKILWIFGILLVLTSGRGGSSIGSGSGWRFGSDDLPRWNTDLSLDPRFSLRSGELTEWYAQNIAPLVNNPEQHVKTWIGVGVGILVFALIMAVIAAFVRYVSETAVLRMVDDHEQTGAKVGFKLGWKQGWSKRAFRLWLIDLIICVPVILVILLLVGSGVLVYRSFEGGNLMANVPALVIGIVFAILFFFAFVLFMVFVSLLREFFSRAAALEGTSLGDCFRFGWKMFKTNWKSASLMWLMLLGFQIAFGIGTMIMFFLLIPAYIPTALAGLVVAAIPGLIAFGITSIFAGAPLNWIVALVAALPLFFVVTFSPLILLQSLFLVFHSIVWTLTYREMKAVENLKPVKKISSKAS